MFLARSPIALEVVGHAQRADDLAQVDRHRLAARDRQDRLLLDLALQRVDRAGRAPMTRCASSASRSHQRIDGVGDLLLGEAAHLGDLAGEVLQVGVEGLDGVFAMVMPSTPRQPKRPVM